MMSETTRQIILTLATAVMAAAILTPLFFVLKLLLDQGLEVVFVAVVLFGLLVAFVLRRETTR